VSDPDLRPVREDDLAMFRRFATEPGLIGLDWAGFQDAQAPARRFAADGYLSADGGRLILEVAPEGAAAGFVSYTAGRYAGLAGYWEIGIALPGRHPPGEPGRAAVAGEGRLHAGGRDPGLRVPRRRVAGRLPVQPAARRPAAPGRHLGQGVRGVGGESIFRKGGLMAI
jgi:hypothetical protein